MVVILYGVTVSFLVFYEEGTEVLNILVGCMLQDVIEVYTIDQVHQSEVI